MSSKLNHMNVPLKTIKKRFASGLFRAAVYFVKRVIKLQFECWRGFLVLTCCNPCKIYIFVQINSHQRYIRNELVGREVINKKKFTGCKRRTTSSGFRCKVLRTGLGVILFRYSL